VRNADRAAALRLLRTLLARVSRTKNSESRWVEVWMDLRAVRERGLAQLGEDDVRAEFCRALLRWVLLAAEGRCGWTGWQAVEGRSMLNLCMGAACWIVCCVPGFLATLALQQPPSASMLHLSLSPCCPAGWGSTVCAAATCRACRWKPRSSWCWPRGARSSCLPPACETGR
jgi:hypothetical protein